MKNLAIFLSGGGTTARAVIDSCKKQDGLLYGSLNPTLVISSKSKAGGIEKAIAGGIPERNVFTRERHEYGSDEAYGDAMISLCKVHAIDVFAQLGWLVKTPRNFLQEFPVGINQHPGPLHPGHPDFGGEGMYGRRVHFARLLFVRMTGRNPYTFAVSHRVTPEYDKGEVLGQTRIDIEPHDDVSTLQERVLPEEHKLQIQVLYKVARGQEQAQTTERLVHKHEMLTWHLVRQMAILAYPMG